MISLGSLTDGRTSSAKVPGAPLHGQDIVKGPSTAITEPTGVNELREVQSTGTLQLSHNLSLPGLQARYLKDTQDYEPLKLADLGPDSFDLVPFNDNGSQGPTPSMLEERFAVIVSDFHLHVILQDYSILQGFTEFITSYRPKSLPLLKYYLSSMKAQAAMHLANSIIHDQNPVCYHGINLKFTENFAERVESQELRSKIAKAFHVLAKDDLSAYVTCRWMNVVEASMKQRVTGLLPPHLKE